MKLHSSYYALDGGTTTLLFTDEINEEQTVVLNQYAYIPQPKYFSDGLPGRLYFNETLIDIRSSEETTLLNLLKRAELREFPKESNDKIQHPSNLHVFGDDLKKIFSQTPEQNLRSMLDEIISFVESDEYVFFAQKVNQKLKENNID